MKKRRAGIGKNHSENHLRIIAGKWRSRKIAFPDVNGLRPTGDRIRETLFNWLAPHLPGATCLDAFAGSGALGFEALSRGAAAVYFIEKDQQACRYLKDNRNALGAENATIYCGDLFQWLSATPDNGFDIIFLDPPFAHAMHGACFAAIEAAGIVHSHTLIYVESPENEPLALPEGWHAEKEKVSGSIRYQLLSRR